MPKQQGEIRLVGVDLASSAAKDPVDLSAGIGCHNLRIGLYANKHEHKIFRQKIFGDNGTV